MSDLVLPRLMQRARAGERDAWASLVERWRHRVVVALMAEGFGVEGARDLAQEAWAAIWDKHQRGELDQLELPGLVIAHARLLAKDQRRRARRALTDGTEEPAVAPVEPRVIAAQTLRRVEAVLGQRPAQQQRIFRRAIEQHIPHADLASEEGLSLQRVRQIIWEVRTALRAELEGEP
ncbi:MAG: sigma-70 family RNA polymerase sigma factor [Myxococcaceae bacterium]